MQRILKIFFILLFLFFSYNHSSFAETDTLIILDASSSMNSSFKDEYRFVYAIKAIESILTKYNDVDKIGLRIINFTENDLKSLFSGKIEICKNTVLSVPIQGYSKDIILSNIHSMNALGMSTPLEYTLKMAIENDFSVSNNLKHIILVTDGGENCDGDPCKYITELSNIRKDVLIDVIAISKSNSKDKELFECITNATQGMYINIDSVDEFEPAIQTFFNNNSGFSTNSNNYNNPQKNVNFPNETDVIYKEYVMEF